MANAPIPRVDRKSAIITTIAVIFGLSGCASNLSLERSRADSDYLKCSGLKTITTDHSDAYPAQGPVSFKMYTSYADGYWQLSLLGTQPDERISTDPEQNGMTRIEKFDDASDAKTWDVYVKMRFRDLQGSQYEQFQTFHLTVDKVSGRFKFIKQVATTSVTTTRIDAMCDSFRQTKAPYQGPRP